MKVSLIFTSNELNPNFSDLSFRDDSIGFIPPLSLMTVAAILEGEGVEVQLIDMEAERLSYLQTLEKLKMFSPDLLGFTLTTYSFHSVLKWIKKFKKDTCLPVMAGGAHVALYPRETMAHKEIDYLIIGEAEIPLPQFIRAFQKNWRNLENIKSIAYRDGDRLVLDTTRQYINNIDATPFPARHLIKNELYSNILTKRKNFTAMLSARGCPYRCAFCDQKTPPRRMRSPYNFFSEIKNNYERFGIREFDIYDSTFTADKKRVIEICDLIKTSGLDVSWTVRSRVDSVNKEVLRALKETGCHTIMYGIESSDPGILKRMRKGISIDRIKDVIAFTKSIGIETLGFFMMGFPGESHKTIQDTVRFSLELPLDYVQYTVLVPFPDTEIYEYYMQSWSQDYWAEYTVDEKNERKIELLGTTVTRQEASRYVSLAYRRFYFRPRIVWRRLSKIKSSKELLRLIRGAAGILKNYFTLPVISNNHKKGDDHVHE